MAAELHELMQQAAACGYLTPAQFERIASECSNDPSAAYLDTLLPGCPVVLHVLKGARLP